ncbi:hypothetical protein SD80_014375 [Scytonema tolypothrichoides VB-61278]|nr:hypothetical protein SD80_014375 [Scytonema tolypothrichoides VB-61278]
MSAKLKLFLIVIISLFATAATGVYIIQRQPSEAVYSMSNEQAPQFSDVNITEEVVNSERANYNTVPLESINSPLQGSDPADLALNAFDNMDSTLENRKVEVFYPYPNQALVTITQIEPTKNFLKAMKYRVELTTFGRSLFVSSPRVWQIVWAGSQVQCIPGSSLSKPQLTQTCQ